MTDRTFTFLFSDIEGSTRLQSTLGSGFDEVLATHRRLLRRVFAEHRGDEIRGNEGDSFFVAFDNPLDAVLAAAAGQQELMRHPWPDGTEVRVRMGLHRGPAEVSARGWTGLSIHVAARVMAAATGASVLATEEVAEAVRSQLPEGLRLRPVGARELKDIPGEVELFEVEGNLAAPPPTPARSEITVGLVDDQEMVRAGFRMILGSRPGIRVVGEAADGIEGVALARSARPDVLLMDIRMPRMDGIEATAKVAALALDPPTRVLVLTTFDLDEYVYEALRAGASGFLLKDAPPADLDHAVRVVARGETLLAPAITRRLVEEFAARRPASDHPATAALRSLSEREREVLKLVARGCSNAEIAAELILGETTVKGYVSSMLAKLNLRDRVQAVILAYDAGVVRPGDVA